MKSGTHPLERIIYSVPVILVLITLSSPVNGQASLATRMLSSLPQAAQNKKALAGQPISGKKPAAPQPTSGKCARTITANVVSLDQPYMLNRLGAAMPQAMIFALAEDVYSQTCSDPARGCKPCSDPTAGCKAGSVILRQDKRPRPIVLRMNVGDCMQVNFNNLLNPATQSPPLDPLQAVTRSTSLHANGMQMVNSINDDGSWVGINPPVDPPTSTTPGGSLVAAGKSKTYNFYAGAEGSYMLYSMGATVGGFGSVEAGQISDGLFGAVNVQPSSVNAQGQPAINPQTGKPYWQAESYRSQVTRADMDLATENVSGRHLVSYDKLYPVGHKYACKPIMKMIDNVYTVRSGQCVADTTKPMKLYYSDPTAIITGPNHGRFPKDFNGPEFDPNPVYPDRWQPYREFTIIYHEVMDAIQAFNDFYNPEMSSTLTSGQDNFAINYGTGGIGAEILANRYQVGPMMNCTECKFEEFFLSSWSVGDPAMVVNAPANIPFPYPSTTNPYGQQDQPNKASKLTKALETTATGGTPSPAVGPPAKVPAGPFPKATVAFYPDDPSNVYHSYLNDHVKFRILNVGGQFTHVHHQHAHQWLHSPNNDNSAYLDSQVISPGAAFTLEMVYNGSGNRNKTIGDSIFHCHFYPHFAAGMWGMWRVHDVYERGTYLVNGVPAADPQGMPPRALPDGEIAAGTPIPGLVPLPTLAVAPDPARVILCGIDASWNGSYTTSNGQCPQLTSKLLGYAALTFAQDLSIGKVPGYPFFIPGIAGHRAPHPPFDYAYEIRNNQKEYLDGGLPRNVIIGGGVSHDRHNQWDFTKENDKLIARQLPENGTVPEQATMAFNALRNRTSGIFTPEGQPATFVMNGLPRKPGASCPDEPDGKCKAENQFGSQLGAPIADPAMLDDGRPVGKVRRYKAANIQLDVAFNKKGWHFPQQRMITLWGDVAKTVSGDKMPEPFFFRANSETDIIEYWHTNLVPDYYELDDFQVRTPTDILGQHIHLVKFDVLASDGAANGYNYEDGTLSPDDVRKRIDAIRAQNNCPAGVITAGGNLPCPMYKNPPAIFGPAPAGQDWRGAQTTVQRWYADPVDNNQGRDRTLRSVFTHDHFGPSTHQQAGLYAGLLIEPKGSTWTSVDGRQTFGRNDDGGPTSWQANIITGNNGQDSYREFALELQDLALAYNKYSITAQVPYNPDYREPITKNTKPWGWANCINVINSVNGCPSADTGFSSLQAQPQLIAANPGIGTSTFNYRNEPLAFRINDPNCADEATCHDPSNTKTDLSYVYSSTISRLDGALNRQPRLKEPINPGSPFTFPGAFAGAQPLDPYTPLLRAYQNDKVQIRVLVGAHLSQHSFSVHGLKWFFEPSAANSGYRDNQTAGISEHFEFLLDLPFTKQPSAPPPAGQPFSADYLYAPGTGLYDMSHGMWGILRSYNTAGDPSRKLPDLATLPNNTAGGGLLRRNPDNQIDANCPLRATVRKYDISVIYGAAKVNGNSTLPNGQLVYNDRLPGNPIYNANPLIYVPTSSLNADGSLKNPNAKLTPLIVRASAGECIEVTLRNRLNPADTNTQTFFKTPDPNAGTWQYADATAAGQNSAVIPYYPSMRVGLHPQMVSYDVTENNGVVVGLNSEEAVVPLGSKTYRWYAGNLQKNDNPQVAGSVLGTPIELGTANLLSSDPLEHLPYALIAGMVIEPPDHFWCTVPNTTAVAPVCSNVRDPATGTFFAVMDTTVDVMSPNQAPGFREFAAILQNKVYLKWANKTQPGVCGDPADQPPFFTTTAAINFGSEPVSYRNPDLSCFNDGNGVQIADLLSNSSVSQPEAGEIGDPRTPIFTARPGQRVRFRMMHPDGYGAFPDSVFTLHGHVWEEEPYVTSTINGQTVPAALGRNRMSQWMGARDGFGPQAHFDLLLESAGGINKISGDYLYRSFPSFPEYQVGLWGVFRVSSQDNAAVAPAAPKGRLAMRAAKPAPKRMTKAAAGRRKEIQLVDRFRRIDRAHNEKLSDPNLDPKTEQKK